MRSLKERKLSMKWFKHDTNTFSNPQVEMLKEKHGVAGYGVYFQLVELIAGAIDKDNINDWGYLPEVYSIEYLAKKFAVDFDLLQQILETCFSLNLIQKKENKFFCEQVLEKCDEFTEKVKRTLSGANQNKIEPTPELVPSDSGIRRKNKELEEEKEDINTGDRPEIKKSLRPIGSILQDKYGISAEWQDKALRYADKLNIKLTEALKGRWLKVFKQASGGRKVINLERAFTYLVDYPNKLSNEEKIKYFFFIYENGLKENFSGI
jgi:hypothetical protein